MKLMMITGAGLSVGAGLSTYRGEDGSYTAIENEVGRPITELLSRRTLERTPDVIWHYLKGFIASCRAAEPSAAHHAIKVIQENCESFLEITQNVDGLSRAAKVPSSSVIEIHGSIHRFRCMKCGGECFPALGEDDPIPPRCYVCMREGGAVIRPDIVLFSENIDALQLQEAERFVSNDAQALIICGTSMMFPYLARLVVQACWRNIPILYVDPHASYDLPAVIEELEFRRLGFEDHLWDFIYLIKEPADVALPKIAELVRSGCCAEELRLQAIKWERPGLGT